MAARWLLGLLLGATPLAALYDDRPPPAHTGGFDEPDCSQCHFDQPVNDGLGTLAIEGLPARFRPGERYPLTVRLAREGMARGGFQLSARFAEGPAAGAQAGALAAGDGRTAVAVSRGVQYLHHTRAGSVLAEGHAALWSVEWVAPAEVAGPVVFHLAGNAADGDASPLEDYVYTHAARSEPR